MDLVLDILFFSNIVALFILVIVQDYASVTGSLRFYVFVACMVLFWRHITFLGTWRSCKVYSGANSIKVTVKSLLVFGWIHLVFQALTLIPVLKYL